MALSFPMFIPLHTFGLAKVFRIVPSSCSAHWVPQDTGGAQGHLLLPITAVRVRGHLHQRALKDINRDLYLQWTSTQMESLQYNRCGKAHVR